MTYYLIGGLGADKRVFDLISINADTVFLKWLGPFKQESLVSYVNRLSAQIDTKQPYGIIGVSFGGIVAVELAKILKPKYTVLISSVSKSSQLPKAYLALGKLGLLNLIPNGLIKPPQVLLNFMFGAKNKLLLTRIIDDTDPTFIRWALQRIIKWESDFELDHCIRIHGTSDRLIPLQGEAKVIEGGGHFMIVDMADKISELINEMILSN